MLHPFFFITQVSDGKYFDRNGTIKRELIDCHIALDTGIYIYTNYVDLIPNTKTAA